MFLFLLLFITFLAICLYVRIRQMSILERNGIPGPKPSLLSGNMFQHLGKANVLRYSEYFEKYGKIVGYYVGQKPIVLISDFELIRQIQIKDFANFADREQPILKYGLHPNPRFFHNIITASGSRWKEMRTILNPTFSAAKLKTMTPLMNSCADIFMSKVEKAVQKDEEFDIYLAFQLLTTDVIAKCALGIDTDVQNNPHDEFFKAAKSLFDSKPNYFFLLFLCFPDLDLFLYPFRRGIEILRELFGLSQDKTLSKLVLAAINLRSTKPATKKNDLLQLMLDARATKEEIDSTNAASLTIDLSNESKEQSSEQAAQVPVKMRNVKALSHDEVVSNSIIFYEAGYETTSTALGFMAHLLVTYPEIQEKVRAEVMQLLSDNGKIDYASLSKLTYMQCFINESMRYYPPVTAFVTRSAKRDYHYRDIVIPANTTVRIPAFQLHHDPEVWPEPSVFDPERFRDKANNSIAFQPFGNGPRNCIGMRFALYEIKLTLAKLLSKYRLVPGPSTETELTIEYKFITETPKNGVFLKAIPI